MAQCFLKNLSPFIWLFSLLFSSCTVLWPTPSPKQYGADDYAVGEARPYRQEVALAKRRLQNFIRRADAKQKRLLARAPYVAVQANELVAGEIWPLLRDLATGQARATQYYMQDFRNRSEYPVRFLLIFDDRTQRLLKPEGVLIIDTPSRGYVAEFAGTKAIYAGTGWW